MVHPTVGADPFATLLRRRLGSLEQPSIWLRPHKGERIPHSRRRSWGRSSARTTDAYNEHPTWSAYSPFSADSTAYSENLYASARGFLGHKTSTIFRADTGVCPYGWMRPHNYCISGRNYSNYDNFFPIKSSHGSILQGVKTFAYAVSLSRKLKCILLTYSYLWLRRR